MPWLLPHIRIMTLMEGVLKEAGTAYLSRAPGLTPGISWGHVADYTTQHREWTI
jgi:hypothetical protein